MAADDSAVVSARFMRIIRALAECGATIDQMLGLIKAMDNFTRFQRLECMAMVKTLIGNGEFKEFTDAGDDKEAIEEAICYAKKAVVDAIMSETHPNTLGTETTDDQEEAVADAVLVEDDPDTPSDEVKNDQ